MPIKQLGSTFVAKIPETPMRFNFRVRDFCLRYLLHGLEKLLLLNQFQFD